MLGFLRGLFYRPVCYGCKYANKNVWRPADFTIGDFWGCAEINQLFHEKKDVLWLLQIRKRQRN